MTVKSEFRTGRIHAAGFLELAGTIPVVDVRSPSEYAAGHIPGALNIPIFDDNERAIVGTRYRKEGRVPAIIEGLRLSGPEMSKKLERGLSASGESGRLLLYCWRGGMRSEAMAWLFSLGGISAAVLEGGYKAYRNHILAVLSEKRKMIVLGGMTGSGKTHIINQLKKMGEQAIDLEGIASHKGSAFGSLGQPPQPSTEHFANMLFEEWKKLDPDRPVWLEDESRNIGSVFLPDEFFINMQNSRVIAIMMEVAARLPRLLAEYSYFSPEELKGAVVKISKRMGGDNTREALEAIDAGNIARAIEISLLYYDKAYLFGLGRKPGKDIIYVNAPTDNTEANARSVLEASRNIKW